MHKHIEPRGRNRAVRPIGQSLGGGILDLILFSRVVYSILPKSLTPFPMPFCTRLTYVIVKYGDKDAAVRHD
jgi:hypothetical protein